MSTDSKDAFLKDVRRLIPSERLYTDELRRLAWGTDASFYRLIPRVVIRSKDEREMSQIMKLAKRHGVPLTFRAAGTSLSGQAITDSVLVVAGKNWEGYSIEKGGEEIVLQPGVVGDRVNRLLAPFGRRIGPDPASIKSAMVGGIVCNNASGMNCGTHANSDKMLLSVRIVLADGTVLDTGSEASREAFRCSHPAFLRRIEQLRDEVRRNTALAERIAKKYAIKNVTGLNIRPLVAYDDSFDIIAHSIVGSEGTLAFLSEVRMKTIPVETEKSTAMLYFRSMREACEAVVAMKALRDEDGPILKSAEMLDYKSLASVDDEVYKKYMSEKPEEETVPGITAVLAEVKCHRKEQVMRQKAAVLECLREFDAYVPFEFTEDPQVCAKFWAIRSGIFPSVGGMREPGTTCMIEDVAFPIEQLPNATVELQQLLARHGYEDACIYGHALEGNYHFIINQSFRTPEDTARYERLMEDVVALVVDRYDGSLKAEHGTGRNMAPFVRHEWGEEAYAVMKQLKSIFDEQNLLNRGVIFNEDSSCHIRHLKPLPLLKASDRNPDRDLAEKVYGKLNRCIECGFCEVNCVSCGFTLSSRQRIVVRREMARLQQTEENAPLLALLQKQYHYPGNKTCAGDGLCSTSCPMGIDVAALTHLLRQESACPGSTAYSLATWTACHFPTVKNALRLLLSLAHVGHALLGTRIMNFVARGLHRVGVPLWTSSMPRPFRFSPQTSTPSPLKVVYFPSCINQTMGLPKDSPVKEPLADKMVSLLHKAGYEVIYPRHMENLCCGTIWESKGMPDVADQKVRELEERLWEASEEGRYPVLCDQSPCLYRMRTHIRKMHLYEPVEFILSFLKDRLCFVPTERTVVLHVTCSMRKMGLDKALVDLARMCSKDVVVPEEVGCCAFAGDKGFTHPELNEYALRKLKSQIQAKGNALVGYSNSRTCEIGLQTHAGIPYVSIVYLVDECTVSR